MLRQETDRGRLMAATQRLSRDGPVSPSLIREVEKALDRLKRTGAWGTVLAVAGLMLALFLVALDQTVVGTALPTIIADLNGFEHYAWVTTAYLLASTAMIPVVGK